MDTIGELRHRIEIYSISSSIDPDYGGETGYNEVLHATVWAAWQPRATFTGEDVKAAQKDDIIKVNWSIRYRGDVTSEMLIKYEGIYYNILSVLPDALRCYTLLETEQVGTNWTKT